MNLPFTPDQFFNVFAQYNHALWWAAAGLWIAGGLAVSAAWNDRSGRSRRLMWYLAVLWAWNAMAYHVAFFARVNPAAWIFAAAFMLQALLFVFAATRRDFDFFTAGGWRKRTGGALIIYAFVYPMLNSAFGHEYPGTPTFGVPCPTAILTLGLLLTVRARAAGGSPLFRCCGASLQDGPHSCSTCGLTMSWSSRPSSRHLNWGSTFLDVHPMKAVPILSMGE